MPLSKVELRIWIALGVVWVGTWFTVSPPKLSPVYYKLFASAFSIRHQCISKFHVPFSYQWFSKFHVRYQSWTSYLNCSTSCLSGTWLTVRHPSYFLYIWKGAMGSTQCDVQGVSQETYVLAMMGRVLQNLGVSHETAFACMACHVVTDRGCQKLGSWLFCLQIAKILLFP